MQFIATDETRQNIPWVRVIDGDGQATDDVDVTQELPADLLTPAHRDTAAGLVAIARLPDYYCHGGKHLNEQGEAIQLLCNLCHSIPVMLQADDRAKIDEIGKQRLVIARPASHEAPSSMADHRFQANESCQECHGPSTFGADDTSFCSDSACRGQRWPEVQLDAGQVHSIPLAGAHARAWCYQCHNGERAPVYFCNSCHEVPHGPGHESCEQCHTTENWIPSSDDGNARMSGECLSCHGEKLPSS